MSNAFLQLLTWKFHVKYSRGSGRAIEEKITQEPEQNRAESGEKKRERERERERARERKSARERAKESELIKNEKQTYRAKATNTKVEAPQS